MQKKLSTLFMPSLLVMLLSVASVLPLDGQSTPADGSSPSMPKVGDMAPDFTLKYFDGNDRKDLSLSQYRGKKNVVLAFFIFAFTGG
jgi:AhpC/TSA family